MNATGTTRGNCLEHSGHMARLARLEDGDKEQWTAIDDIRVDIKKLLAKIGVIVGGISVINTIVVAIVVHFMTKGG